MHETVAATAELTGHQAGIGVRRVAVVTFFSLIQLPVSAEVAGQNDHHRANICLDVIHRVIACRGAFYRNAIRSVVFYHRGGRHVVGFQGRHCFNKHRGLQAISQPVLADNYLGDGCFTCGFRFGNLGKRAVGQLALLLKFVECQLHRVRVARHRLSSRGHCVRNTARPVVGQKHGHRSSCESRTTVTRPPQRGSRRS